VKKHVWHGHFKSIRDFIGFGLSNTGVHFWTNMLNYGATVTAKERVL